MTKDYFNLIQSCITSDSSQYEYGFLVIYFSSFQKSTNLYFELVYSLIYFSNGVRMEDIFLQ